jgi:cyclin B
MSLHIIKASTKYRSNTARCPADSAPQSQENDENVQQAPVTLKSVAMRRPLGNITNPGTNNANIISDADTKTSGLVKPFRPAVAPVARSKPLARRNSSYSNSQDQSATEETAPMETESTQAPVLSQSSQNADVETRCSQSSELSGTARARSSRTPDDIDARDAFEQLAVIEYVGDMYSYFRTREMVTVDSSYMLRQPHINERMRAILIDWLVEVHLKFKLVPDTLYLTIALIDKYLEIKCVSRQSLQLVGVSCFLIAAKYEEIYPPEIRDLVYITDRAYTKEQILEMESSILEALRFQISFPTVYCFLLRYLKAAHADKRIVQLACYIAERMLQEYTMMQHLPSTIAACAVYIARKNLNRNPWSPTLLHYTKYSETDLHPCLLDMSVILTPKNDLVAVHRKFSSTKFGAVATMNIEVLSPPSTSDV